MRSLSMCTGTLLLVLLASGCASVQTGEEWSRLKTNVQERTGYELIWEQSEREEKVVREEVAKLLANGLTRDEAVRIALLNNRTLQSTLEEIGIAKSDLIQAGLFRNPSLSALFRFPFHGSGTNSEIDAGISLSDFWQIPFRKKVASAHLEMVMMKVEQEVLSMMREAKQAYDSAYYTSLARKEAQAIFQKFKEISAEIEERREFGFLGDLDVYSAQTMEAESEMALHRVETDLLQAKARLDRVLGLGIDQTRYKIGDELDELSDEVPAIPGREKALEHALGHRLDIQTSLFKIAAADKKLKMEKAMVLKEVHLGASYEKDTDGDEVFGPGIDIQIPVFHQNQAQIAKARFLVRRARKKLQALKGQIREEIARDLSQIDLHAKRLRLLKERVIPVRQKAMEYSHKWVNAMQLNRLYLLEAQKGLLEGTLDSLSARMELNHAITQLEYHLGGNLPAPH